MSLRTAPPAESARRSLSIAPTLREWLQPKPLFGRLILDPPRDLRRVGTAIDRFASAARDETIVALLDDTVLRSGKSGLLFSDKALYVSPSHFEIGSRKAPPVRVQYDQLRDAALCDDITLKISMRDGTSLDLCSPSSDWLLPPLLAVAAVESRSRTGLHRADASHDTDVVVCGGCRSSLSVPVFAWPMTLKCAVCGSDLDLSLVSVADFGGCEKSTPTGMIVRDLADAVRTAASEGAIDAATANSALSRLAHFAHARSIQDGRGVCLSLSPVEYVAMIREAICESTMRVPTIVALSSDAFDVQFKIGPGFSDKMLSLVGAAALGGALGIGATGTAAIAAHVSPQGTRETVRISGRVDASSRLLHMTASAGVESSVSTWLDAMGKGFDLLVLLAGVASDPLGPRIGDPASLLRDAKTDWCATNKVLRHLPIRFFETVGELLDASKGDPAHMRSG